MSARLLSWLFDLSCIVTALVSGQQSCKVLGERPSICCLLVWADGPMARGAQSPEVLSLQACLLPDFPDWTEHFG